MSKVTIIDLKKEWQTGNRSLFSRELIERIRYCLAHKKQVILYLNKRGFSSSLLCMKCGETVYCPHCDVPVVLHKESSARRFLLCHICGRTMKVSGECVKCHAKEMKFVGTGTQKIEEILHDLFPRARVVRVDRDSVRGKRAFEKVYGELMAGEIDILIGTQILTKGLDIPNVYLVGVLLADVGLHIPDFRANEKVFQNLFQVSGRTGRLGRRGEVIIQTLLPQHSAVIQAAEGNYETFYAEEVKSRKLHDFPPFTRLIKLIYVHKDQQKAREAAEEFVRELQWTTEHKLDRAVEVLDHPVSVPRMHDKYHYSVLLKGKEPKKLLDLVPLPRGWKVDVDPVNVSV